MHSFYVIKQTLKISWRSIMADKLRTLLTCLGIIIGTASLIVMMTILDISTEHAKADIEKRGRTNTDITLYSDDVCLIDEQVEYLSSIDGVKAYSTVTDLYDLIIYANNKVYDRDISCFGVDSDYFAYMKNISFVEGRGISPKENENSEAVCVINTNLSELVFGENSPLGESIILYGVPMKVVGVYSAYDESDGDFRLYVSASITRVLTGIAPRRIILFPENMDAAKKVHLLADRYIEGFYHVRNDIYGDAYDDETYEHAMAELKNRMILQGAVALIALIIGGIGIMNMMLVMVSERTDEIGLRKALGASPGRIQLQFVLESLMLSLLGGIIGVIAGVAVSLGSCYFSGEGLHFNIPSVFASLIFAMFVGVAFGYSPAKSASMLLPIDALKGE